MNQTLWLSPRAVLPGALTLLGLLALPAVRHALEASMTLHMLVQYPLLALAGCIGARALPERWRARAGALRHWNAHGITGLFATALVLAILMIPRVLDLALTDPRVELGKMLALIFSGAALQLSWRPAGLLVQGFFLGNVLPMMAVVGTLYESSPVRICNAYLLDDQARLGQMLVWVSAGVALIWFAGLVRALMHREAAAPLPTPRTDPLPAGKSAAP